MISNDFLMQNNDITSTKTLDIKNKMISKRDIKSTSKRDIKSASYIICLFIKSVIFLVTLLSQFGTNNNYDEDDNNNNNNTYDNNDVSEDENGCLNCVGT